MSFIALLVGIILGAWTFKIAIQPTLDELHSQFQTCIHSEHSETTVYKCASNEWVLDKPKIKSKSSSQ